ncbi:MAG: hypothetical protein DRO12_00450 [Thermoprotei archaeon]|nr:MAG: hypothetical protein DRO12_00450 [Thermoprotei archaeon]
MRILIDNAVVVTLSSDRPLIQNAYIYIDRGMVISVSEGEPPEEYQYAEYIIDGSGRVVMPGFSLGFMDPLRVLFRHVDYDEHKLVRYIEEVLSRKELDLVFEALLASLESKGFTGVVTFARTPFIARMLARASSSAWIRTRIVLQASDEAEVVSELKKASKEVKEPDALSKAIVGFGALVGDANLMNNLAGRYPEYHIYVRSNLLKGERVPRNIVVLGHTDERVKKVVVDEYKEYVEGDGFGVLKRGFSTPTTIMLRLLESMSIASGDPYEVSLKALTTWNYLNSDLGIGEIREGASADLIILNFREPPSWPLIVSGARDLYKAIVEGDYVIESVIVGGEVVVDKGENLMVGSAVIKRARPILEELCKAVRAWVL